MKSIDSFSIYTAMGPGVLYSVHSSIGYFSHAHRESVPMTI